MAEQVPVGHSCSALSALPLPGAPRAGDAPELTHSCSCAPPGELLGPAVEVTQALHNSVPVLHLSPPNTHISPSYTSPNSLNTTSSSAAFPGVSWVCKFLVKRSKEAQDNSQHWCRSPYPARSKKAGTAWDIHSYQKSPFPALQKHIHVPREVWEQPSPATCLPSKAASKIMSNSKTAGLNSWLIN